MSSTTSKYQNFEVKTISRSEIKNAEYNPRIMDKSAKKRLKEALKKHGLVSALTWNKRTGNLVGGHQRLEQLDSLENDKNYSLTVCVIDVDEKEEATLNVHLNNPSIQGDWDLDKLADMTSEFNLSFDDMGFSKLDVDFMFDSDERFTKLFDTKETNELKTDLEEIKRVRKENREKLKEKNSLNWYSVIVFENGEQKAAFYKDINTPISEEYLTVDEIMRLCNQRNKVF